MAEEKHLFPVFEVPEVAAFPAAQEQKYKPSFRFNFEAGDFVLSGAGNLVPAGGRRAYEQWCRKMVATERMDCLAYGQDIGAELRSAQAQPGEEAVCSALERTITETLLVNPRTEYVRGFTFERTGDGLACSFTVKGRGWEEFPVSVLLEK